MKESYRRIKEYFMRDMVERLKKEQIVDGEQERELLEILEKVDFKDGVFEYGFEEEKKPMCMPIVDEDREGRIWRFPIYRIKYFRIDRGSYLFESRPPEAKKELGILDYIITMSMAIDKCYLKEWLWRGDVFGVYDCGLAKCVANLMFKTHRLSLDEYKKFRRYLSYYITAIRSDLVRLPEDGCDLIVHCLDFP